MPKSKQQKEQDLQELTEKLKSAKGVVFTDYRGATVKDITKFRKNLTAEKVFTKVYKLTLVEKALKAMGVEAKLEFKAPVIMAISQDDETTAARIIKSLAKDMQTVNIVSGMADNAIISKQQVLALADLPSKDMLRAQIVGTIKSPITGFVNVLAGSLRGLVNVLNAIAQK